MKCVASLGNTTYILEDEEYSSCVKLTRKGAMDKRPLEVWFPKKLMEQFIMNGVKQKLYTVVDKILEGK